SAENTVRLALSEFLMPEASRAEFRLSSSGMLDVWLNGRLVYSRAEAGKYATDSDQFEADLEPGLNRLIVQVSAAGPAEMHTHFRRKSATQRHETLSQLALAKSGNVVRGR